MRLWRYVQRLVGTLGRQELLFLLALLVPGILLLGFGKLADEVVEGETLRFDEAALVALRNPADLADPIGPAWLEAALRDVTALGGTAVLTLLTLVVLAYLLMARKRATALLVLVSVGGGTLLSSVLKTAFNRPRPDLVAHIVEVSSASFPSGHAMMSAVVYLTLGALLARVEPEPRLKVFLLGVAVFLAVVVGLSRVYLGVHYPTDVVAGWTLGAGWALLCWLLALWLQRRGQVER